MFDCEKEVEGSKSEMEGVDMELETLQKEEEELKYQTAENRRTETRNCNRVGQAKGKGEITKARGGGILERVQ